ncbi:MAG: hypothetical protein PHC88_13950 [Terrimicrobiaceae bacterium]|nr:hypothetical protein [Terrimicrobiaceae bacterium]
MKRYREQDAGAQVTARGVSARGRVSMATLVMPMAHPWVEDGDGAAELGLCIAVEEYRRVEMHGVELRERLGELPGRDGLAIKEQRARNVHCDESGVFVRLRRAGRGGGQVHRDAFVLHHRQRDHHEGGEEEEDDVDERDDLDARLAPAAGRGNEGHGALARAALPGFQQQEFKIRGCVFDLLPRLLELRVEIVERQQRGAWAPDGGALGAVAAWKQHARIKKLRMFYNGKPLYDITFADSRRWQTVTFDDILHRSPATR